GPRAASESRNCSMTMRNASPAIFLLLSRFRRNRPFDGAGLLQPAAVLRTVLELSPRLVTFWNARLILCCSGPRAGIQFRIPRAESAWGMPSLESTDVGSKKTGNAASRAAGVEKFSNESAAEVCSGDLGGN